MTGEISTTPEMQAVRAGGPTGGVTELAKLELRKWLESAKEGVVARIGLSGVEAKIEGNENASDRVKSLGRGIIYGVNGISHLLKTTAEKAEERSKRKNEKAVDYERRLAKLQEEPLEAKRLNMLYELANATLEMHGLPGEVKPKEVNIIERSRKKFGELGDEIKKRFFKWRAEVNNSQAEGNLRKAKVYSDAADAIRQLASTFEEIIERNSRGEELKKQRDEFNDEAMKSKTNEENAAQQFKNVITTGRKIAEGGREQIYQETDPKAQEQILKNLQEAVAKTGM